MPLDETGLTLKVQQEPELETRIGDGQLDVVGRRLLSSVWDQGMLIDIEDAPNLSEARVRVARTASETFRFSLLGHSPLDQCLGRSTLIIHDKVYRGSKPMTEIGEVFWLSGNALADN